MAATGEMLALDCQHRLTIGQIGVVEQAGKYLLRSALARKTARPLSRQHRAVEKNLAVALTSKLSQRRFQGAALDVIGLHLRLSLRGQAYKRKRASREHKYLESTAPALPHLLPF